MNREMRIDATVKAIETVGTDEDLGLNEARVNPERYLLVEKNLGSAAYMQSHWFGTHETLEAAWDNHQGQEHVEDWQLEFAVDLDTGVSYVPGRSIVEWHEEVRSGNDR
jgi:hypothetical protein